MKTIFDCNIYDKFSSSVEIVALVKNLLSGKRLSVMVTPYLLKEILLSPYAILANSLPVTFVGESVFLAGVQMGDRVGSGRLFAAHSENSKQFNDALIAGAAEHEINYLVTDDNRLRKRMDRLAVRGIAITYVEFKGILRTYTGI